MIRLTLLGTLVLLMFGLGCYENLASDQSSANDDWNSIRSDWTDSQTYSSDSPEANGALQDLQSTSAGNSVYTLDHFQVILQNVTTNADGTQTWTYAITKIADGPQNQDLSHFTLLMDACDSTNLVELGGGSFGPDSSSTACAGDQDGLKWDRSVGAGETVTFSFTTDQAYEVGDVTGLVKYGTSCNTGTIPGPDCSNVVVVDDPGNDDPPDDGTGNTDPNTGGEGCPSWIDTLSLSATVAYKNFHGYNNYNFPVYYVGETMRSDLTICNNTPFNATGLTVTTIVEKYPGGGLACGDPVQTWSGVTIAANDCLVLDHSFYLDRNCAWGNYESHLMVTREADDTCPVAALVMQNGVVGYFDP